MRPEKLLFTPGPLNTSPTVKQAMLTDMGSRDVAFIQLIAEVRSAILGVAGVSREDGYEAIPIQGSGTFGVEAVLASAVGPDDRLLFLVNGAYGRRMVDIAECLELDHEVYEVAENELHVRSTLDSMLASSHFTHIAAVHCETTTGILNPVEHWGQAANRYDCKFIVDAMSSFGGVVFDFPAANIDFLITSANKCLQGVPGLAIVVARRASVLAAQHRPRSLSLDLRQQLLGFEHNGQFRFTPPTHVLLALQQAIRELEEEGGVAGRADRYRSNHQVLCCGMRELGFREYVPPAWQSDIITAFQYTDDGLLDGEKFDFEDFYRRLSEFGMLIYPGKTSKAECFRIGTIGHLVPQDIMVLLNVIKRVLGEMRAGQRR